MNQKQIIRILVISVLSFCLGIGLGMMNDSTTEKNQQVVNSTTPESSIQSTEFTVKKGAVYTRQSFVDINDPFNVPIIDTITVLDLQTSKNENDLIYVKWTFNNWHDTTRFLSTELKIFTIGLQEIK